MEDSAIIRLYQKRDETAIEQSDKKYGGYCRSVAAGLLESREDREECVSDTWLSAWNSIPPTLPRSLRAFLGRITRNHALKRLENLTAEKRGGGVLPLPISELEECVPARHSTEGEVEARRLADSLRRFLRGLPAEERRVFLERHWACRPLTDIARKYDLSEGAVKSRLHRTREKLRAHLEKEEFDL